MLIAVNCRFFAHTDSGYAWGGPIEPWEIHPALSHLPIAFLLGGCALDLYAWLRKRADLAPVASGLLIAGLISGVITALAGFVAFFTVPAHTDEAHELMYWHLGIQAASLTLFAWPAWIGWRNRRSLLAMPSRIAGWIAAILLTIGSGIGGYIVYHGAAGIEPQLLSPELRGGHKHAEP